MATVNQIVGDDTGTVINGTSGPDLIYGFDPNAAAYDSTSITATRVATGLELPVFATAAPGDYDRLFVVEQSGDIEIVDLQTGQVQATPFLDLTDEINFEGESGLLGLTFDPNFAQNGYFYVDLVNVNGDTEVRRYQVSATDPNHADPASGLSLITIDQPDFSNHKAGWIDFGPDGYLYIATGDGGGGGDPLESGQDINSLLGKILRINVGSDAFPTDPARNYAIPSDNMFVGVAGADEIYAMGLRNPFRDSFDRATGTFFIGDVGQNLWEEIDIGQLGANYGWDVREGPAGYEPGPLGGGTLTEPIYSYDHSVGTTVIGGYVYRGESLGLQGQYFYADYGSGHIYTLEFNGSTWVSTDRTGQIHTDVGAIDLPDSFGEDANGNLYIVDIDGDIFRLTPSFVTGDLGDTLDGMGGADTMYGGAGNDSYKVNDIGDVVVEGAELGTDTVTASVSFTLTPNVENLVLDPAAGAINATGNIENNVVTGNASANTYTYVGGHDTFAGGGGADTIDFSLATGPIQIDLTWVGTQGWTWGGASQPLVDLQSVENITGSRFSDLIAGDDGANFINGGAGIDTASFATAEHGVVADLLSLVAAGDGSDVLISIENLTGSAHNDELYGSNVANRILGDNGSDTIWGRNGSDSLDGGGGKDVIKGGAGNDIIDGGTGNDRLSGELGRDTFQFDDDFGLDSIGGFTRGQDKIDFTMTDLRFSDIDISDSGPNVLVTTSEGSIMVHNVSSLSASDFLF